MTTLVKVHRKGQMTLPSRLRAAIGVAEGDLVEASVQHGKIVLTPKLVIDRSKFPNADDDYTPAQRRIIDARLANSDQDIQRGRTYGPFSAADEMIASLEANIKKLKAGKRKTKLVR
ncbi:MAG: AbrB/MazE/SpoVT family DNA-binding domain-containing protein [Bryobacteraceae bacterium]|jgi:AbrB family looped-hinge helix DNA binding protein